MYLIACCNPAWSDTCCGRWRCLHSFDTILGVHNPFLVDHSRKRPSCFRCSNSIVVCRHDIQSNRHAWAMTYFWSPCRHDRNVVVVYRSHRQTWVAENKPLFQAHRMSHDDTTQIRSNHHDWCPSWWARPLLRQENSFWRSCLLPWNRRFHEVEALWYGKSHRKHRICRLFVQWPACEVVIDINSIQGGQWVIVRTVLFGDCDMLAKIMNLFEHAHWK